MKEVTDRLDPVHAKPLGFPGADLGEVLEVELEEDVRERAWTRPVNRPTPLTGRTLAALGGDLGEPDGGGDPGGERQGLGEGSVDGLPEVIYELDGIVGRRKLDRHFVDRVHLVDRRDRVDARHEPMMQTDVLDRAMGKDVDRGELASRLPRAHAGFQALGLGFAAHADEGAVAVLGSAGVDADRTAPKLRAKVLLGGREETVHVDVAVPLGARATRRRTATGRRMRVRLRHDPIVRP